MVRVDVDYDGAWEAGPAAPSQAVEASFDSVGTYYILVEVTDSGGLSSRALNEVIVTVPGDEDEDSGGCGCRVATTGTGRTGLAPLLFGLVTLVVVRRRLRCHG